jgi:TetR/AcrR family transcriptional regulator, regulator of cefoperazone and chloramphenicol sensitivity
MFANADSGIFLSPLSTGLMNTYQVIDFIASADSPSGGGVRAEREMSRKTSAPRKTSKAPAVASVGYRKGEETRQRILGAALRAFGADAFKAVTIRQISEAAEVSLPTLQYYFGDKEGLYRACAETIVERYRGHMTTAGTRAAEVLKVRCTGETARAQLKGVIKALGGFLVGSKEAELWTPFVHRELRDPGPAFEILYENLWRPGVELIARLIARIWGRSDDDPDARVRALLLIFGLLAFQPGRSLSLRTMRWSSIGPDELAMVLSNLDAQIDAIGAS